MRIFILLLMCLGIGGKVHARPSLDNEPSCHFTCREIKIAVLGIFFEMEKVGLDRIGNRKHSIRTDELKDFFNALSWELVDKISKPAGAQRRSGFGAPVLGIVYLDSAEYGSAEDPELLLFHEGLVALGFQDDHYEISAGVFAFLNVQRTISNRLAAGWSDKIKNFLRTEISLIPQSPTCLIRRWPECLMSLRARGGVDAVGSGGDAASLALKTRLLGEFLERSVDSEVDVVSRFRFALRVPVDFYDADAFSKSGTVTYSTNPFGVSLTRFAEFPDWQQGKRVSRESFDSILDFFEQVYEVKN